MSLLAEFRKMREQVKQSDSRLLKLQDELIHCQDELLLRAIELLDLELDCVPFGDMGEVEWQRKREEWLRDVGVKK